jgi:hypothetical protein
VESFTKNFLESFFRNNVLLLEYRLKCLTFFHFTYLLQTNFWLQYEKFDFAKGLVKLRSDLQKGKDLNKFETRIIELRERRKERRRNFLRPQRWGRDKNVFILFFRKKLSRLRTFVKFAIILRRVGVFTRKKVSFERFSWNLDLLISFVLKTWEKPFLNEDWT